MKKLVIYIMILCVSLGMFSCEVVIKEEKVEVSIPDNPATDFEYTTAKQRFGEKYAAKAVKRGEITTVDAVIIRKYVGTSPTVGIPDTIDGKPVEIIDNYAFSPYDIGLERDDEFWIGELNSAGLPLKGNGTSTLKQGNFGSEYFKSFTDAMVSTVYRPTGETGKKYKASENYLYFNEDFDKAINYLKARPKVSHIEHVKLPNSISAIGGGAFMFCDSLKTIKLGSGNIVCNDYAFAFCTELEEINASLTADVDGCFLGCINLKRAVFKGHHLGSFMFAGCINLEYLSVARQTKYAKEYALYRCPKLKSCNFPVSFKLGPDFLDFNTFTARLGQSDASYEEFKEMGYPFDWR